MSKKGRHLPVGDRHLPSVEDAAARIDERTRAIVLVSPGNPTGVTLPPSLIHDFAALARAHDLALILDETYRMFRGSFEPAHHLFSDPDWGGHVVSLHSFSKDFAIPGYRVGAVVGGPATIVEALKVLDCVAISAPRIGQEAALAGLRDAQQWRRDQVRRIAVLEDGFCSALRDRPGGFEIVTSGAYFGWVRHGRPELPTDEVVRRLVLDHDVLVIPGTAFTIGDEQMVRMSFANLTDDQLPLLTARLREFA